MGNAGFIPSTGSYTSSGFGLSFRPSSAHLADAGPNQAQAAKIWGELNCLVPSREWGTGLWRLLLGTIYGLLSPFPLSTRESSDAEMPRPSVFFSMTAVWRLSSRRKMKRAATALLVCALCRGRLATIGALIIRMGFWDPLYYSCNKEPPK